MPLPGPWEQYRCAGSLPHVTLGRLRPEQGVSRGAPWSSQLCCCRASAQGQGSHARHGCPQTQLQSRLGELRAKRPLVVKGTLEDQLSLCLGTVITGGSRLPPVAQSQAASSGPHWPRAWWPLTQRSCPDLRLKEKRPARGRPSRAPAVKGLSAHLHVPLCPYVGQVPGAPRTSRGHRGKEAPVCPPILCGGGDRRPHSRWAGLALPILQATIPASIS